MAQDAPEFLSPRLDPVFTEVDSKNHELGARRYSVQGLRLSTDAAVALDCPSRESGESNVLGEGEQRLSKTVDDTPTKEEGPDGNARLEPDIARRHSAQSGTVLHLDLVPGQESFASRRASIFARSSTASWRSALSGRRLPLHSSGVPPGESSTTLPTFRTARSSFVSWMTASSWQRMPFVQRQILENTKFFKEHGPKDDRYDAFGALVTRVLKEVAACGSQNLLFPITLIQAALHEQLLPLLLGSATSLTDMLERLMIRIQPFIDIPDTSPMEKRISAHIYRFANDFSLAQQKPIIASELRAVYGAFSNEWLTRLEERGIILTPEEELDWSGRGQHVVYNLFEEPEIPLQHLCQLGHGASGVVDKVRCRRIDLARKAILCNRKLTRDEAVKEVAHLQYLQHRHIVRLVGTYLMHKTLFILMYPAAAQNLDQFLDLAHRSKIRQQQVAPELQMNWTKLLFGIIGCLTNVVAFLHEHNVKHMDIKPVNILVDHPGIGSTARVYLTDFGIARSYRSLEESYTSSGIAFTPTYAAPEVVNQDIRGPPADVFSLGCVFLEILATLLSTRLDDQQEALQQTRDGTNTSYRHNVGAVLAWYEGKQVLISENLCRVQRVESVEKGVMPWLEWTALVPLTLATEPEERPTAAYLDDLTSCVCCGACNKGPESFEAADAVLYTKGHPVI